ncbi:hypothetical protein KAU11_01900 [Candidatus Babeliales bacterium]|nr:hypothetical protein [Candidatus Babeliales bacterium]
MVSKKKFYVVAFIGLICLKASLFAREVVDECVATVNGVRFLRSDTKELRIDNDGKPFSIDVIIDEELMIQKAQEYGVTVSAAEIDNQVEAFKRDNGLGGANDKTCDEWLKKLSLNKRRLDRQFYRAGITARLKGSVLTDRGTVEAAVLKKYYKDNPEYEEESYELLSAFLSDDDAERLVKDKKGVGFDWIDLGKIEKKQLASTMLFVAKMPENSISKPFKNGNAGQQVIKMIKKHPRRLKSFDERKLMMEKELYKTEREKKYKEYMKLLRKEASIIKL